MCSRWVYSVSCMQDSNSLLKPLTGHFRGGVEDTRLESKAKDTQKNPRPRPKTKNTRRKCFPKKRSAKNFSRRPQKKGPLREDMPIFRKKIMPSSKKKVFANFQAWHHAPPLNTPLAAGHCVTVYFKKDRRNTQIILNIK